MTIPPRLAPLLAQFDYAWERLTQRLEGLTDAEYFWEPVAGCWTVRPRAACRTSAMLGGGAWVQELELPDPQPAPFTTIAWRVTHLAAWITIRADYTSGTKAMHWNTDDVPGSAEAGRVALATAGEQWRAALTSADDAALDQIGRSANPWGLDPTLPFLDIAWWVNQEALHHGGEIALLRDLYQAWPR
jgi:hypothetical protein